MQHPRSATVTLRFDRNNNANISDRTPIFHRMNGTVSISSLRFFGKEGAFPVTAGGDFARKVYIGGIGNMPNADPHRRWAEFVYNKKNGVYYITDKSYHSFVRWNCSGIFISFRLVSGSDDQQTWPLIDADNIYELNIRVGLKEEYGIEKLPRDVKRPISNRQGKNSRSREDVDDYVGMCDLEDKLLGRRRPNHINL